jgi:hypothetical protein
MAGDPETQELIERIEASRRQLGSRVQRVASVLDVPARLRDQVARHPAWLFGGSAAVGVALTGLLRRSRRKPKGRFRWLRWILPTVFTALKPWLKSLLIQEMQRRLAAPQETPRQVGKSRSAETRSRF